MRILLLQPSYYQDPNGRVVYDLFPPLGLALLAGIARKAGHEVALFDLMGREEQLGTLLAKHAPDVIGVNCLTTFYPQFVELCLSLRGRYGFKGALWAGGPHITLCPQQSLAQSQVDACIVGEGETTFLDALAAVSKGLPLNDTPGLYLPVVGFTPRRPLLRDLSAAADTAFDLLELDRYTARSLFVECSRGCPFGCIYCSSKSIYGNSVRWARPTDIIRQLRSLQKDFGYREFSPLSDTFVANKPWLRSFCDALKDADLGMRFRCNGRLNLMSDDILRLLKDSGCYQVDYGVESVVPRVLKNIKKDYDASTIEEVIRQTVGMGLRAHLYFMLSLPGETEADMDTTIRFANRMKKTYGCTVEFQITRIYPKTPLSISCGEEERDWLQTAELDLPYPNVPAFWAFDRVKILSKCSLAQSQIRAIGLWEGLTRIPDIYRSSRDINEFCRSLARGCKRLLMRPVPKQ